MRMRPILMSAPMVLATLADTKTVTRRLTGLDEVNQDPDAWIFTDVITHNSIMHARFIARNKEPEDNELELSCPYGVAGDGLWVRENFRKEDRYDHLAPSSMPIDTRVWFEADGDRPDWGGKLRPSIHMPLWLSRMDLEILEIHPERLHSITEEDCKREGACRGIFNEYVEKPTFKSQSCLRMVGSYKDGFKYLWISINGRPNWDANPWIWTINYKRLKP